MSRPWMTMIASPLKTHGGRLLGLARRSRSERAHRTVARSRRRVAHSSRLREDVLEGETRTPTSGCMLLLRTAGDPNDPLGPSWVEELARDITALGSAGVSR